jgi:CRISPR-associated exonuclease Cas4
VNIDVEESEIPPEEFISAGELEKYGYCPLSWWYSRQGAEEADQVRLKEGVRDHKEVDRQVKLIEEYEGASKEAEASVAIFSIVATVLAIVALAISVFQTVEWSYATVALALMWLLAAAMFLYVSLRNTERAIRARSKSGIATGHVVDVGASAETGDSIMESPQYGLRGLPDVVLRVEDELIPVEVKTGRVPRGPLFSHILQLAAYCLLIEERQGRPPPYGVLQYGKHVRHEIDYNDELKWTLVNKLIEMRQIIRTGEAHRNHRRPGKCASCSRREGCAERLA